MNQATVEVIYSFDDLEQQIARLYFNLDDTPILTEARVLRKMLDQLANNEIDQLRKCSICIDIPVDADINTVAPWLFDKDSPLYNGKLWLKQFRYATV